MTLIFGGMNTLITPAGGSVPSGIQQCRYLVCSLVLYDPIPLPDSLKVEYETV